MSFARHVPITPRLEAAPTEVSPIRLLTGDASLSRRKIARLTSRDDGLRSRGHDPRPTVHGSSSAEPSSASLPTADDETALSSSSSKRQPKTQITRHRQILSCVECRNRKHKCDKKRPVCDHCIRSGRQARCIYIDHRDRKQKVSDVTNAHSEAAATPSSSKSPLALSLSTVQSHARVDVSDHEAEYGARLHSNSLEHPVPSASARESLSLRLARVRTEALIRVLGEHPDLFLPTVDEADSLLETFRDRFEPYVRSVNTDLNCARFERCLRWWHGRYRARERALDRTLLLSMPDPTSFPLMLTIFALSLQAGEAALPFNCPSQTKLIRVAGDCVDALQAACPPNWATAFTAPNDLVKAIANRGRWFLHRLQLQMAGSCFASAIHLACASGLNRDGANWPQMRPAETEARRQIWWSVIAECLYANRMQQFSCLLPMPADFDVKIPREISAMHFQNEAVLDNYPDSVLLSRRTPLATDTIEFEFHTTRALWTQARLKRTDYCLHEGLPLSSQRVHELDKTHFNIRSELSAALKWTEEDEDVLQQPLANLLSIDTWRSQWLDQCRAAGTSRPTPSNLDQEALVARRHFLERVMLEMEFHQNRLDLHLPRISLSSRISPGKRDRDNLSNNDSGNHSPPHLSNLEALPASKRRECETSLNICLSSAQSLLSIVASLLPCQPAVPPVFLEPLLHSALSAGMVLAIHVSIDDGGPIINLLRALLRRLFRALKVVSSGALSISEQDSHGPFSPSTLSSLGLSSSDGLSSYAEKLHGFLSELSGMPTSSAGLRTRSSLSEWGSSEAPKTSYANPPRSDKTFSSTWDQPDSSSAYPVSFYEPSWDVDLNGEELPTLEASSNTSSLHATQGRADGSSLMVDGSQPLPHAPHFEHQGQQPTTMTTEGDIFDLQTLGLLPDGTIDSSAMMLGPSLRHSFSTELMEMDPDNMSDLRNAWQFLFRNRGSSD